MSWEWIVWEHIIVPHICTDAWMCKSFIRSLKLSLIVVDYRKSIYALCCWLKYHANCRSNVDDEVGQTCENSVDIAYSQVFN